MSIFFRKTKRVSPGGLAKTGIQHIQTAGDIRRGIAHLTDDWPVAFDHNNYPTTAYFEPSVEGGYTIITVEANDTCYRSPADYAAEYNAKAARAYGDGIEVLPKR